jgi:hypothetical protein
MNIKNNVLLTNFAFALVAAMSAPLAAQTTRTSAQLSPTPIVNFAVSATNYSYADVADLVVNAPLIVDVSIRKATPVPAQQAVGVPVNLQRMLIEGDVMALLRSKDGMGGTVRFLLDVPKDAKGKIPKLKKQRYFLFANKVAAMPGTIRLIRPNALAEWSPANDNMVRAITREAVQLDAPQAITALTSASYSPGDIPGEGDTQIFLNAAGGQPYSISVTSRAGKPKSWTVSMSDLIEEGASAPKRNTILWYRLACGMPPTLSAEQIESADTENAARAQADYAFVLQSLGKCDRMRR